MIFATGPNNTANITEAMIVTIIVRTLSRCRCIVIERYSLILEVNTGSFNKCFSTCLFFTRRGGQLGMGWLKFVPWQTPSVH